VTGLERRWGRRAHRLRALVIEQHGVPWRVRQLVKRVLYRPRRLLKYGRLDINSASYWDARWREEGLETWRVYPERFARIEALVPDGAWVLDVGCGVGVLLERLRRARDARVYGVDLSPAAVTLLASRGIVGAAAAAGALPFGAATFDVVIATELLEHLADPAAAMHELVRCLRPGGRLIVTVPNGVLGPEDEDEHMQRFTGKKLQRLFDIEGVPGAFDVVEQWTVLAHGMKPEASAVQMRTSQRTGKGDAA
jgi:SAM-dependent methyltransferase